MKRKDFKTSLKYNCKKGEDFDYIEGKWIKTYNRTFHMVVTAATKEKTDEVMESFMGCVLNKKIQNHFDGNSEPEFDDEIGKWTGTVLIYIENDFVEDEKEIVRDAYKEWKESLKINSEFYVKKEDAATSKKAYPINMDVVTGVEKYRDMAKYLIDVEYFDDYVEDKITWEQYKNLEKDLLKELDEINDALEKYACKGAQPDAALDIAETMKKYYNKMQSISA